MSMTLIPCSRTGITASALALWGRAENTRSRLPSNSGVMLRFKDARWGNTSARFCPAALRPVTEVRLASGCWYRIRASSQPAYPVTLIMPTFIFLAPLSVGCGEAGLAYPYVAAFV